MDPPLSLALKGIASIRLIFVTPVTGEAEQMKEWQSSQETWIPGAVGVGVYAIDVGVDSDADPSAGGGEAAVEAYSNGVILVVVVVILVILIFAIAVIIVIIIIGLQYEAVHANSQFLHPFLTPRSHCVEAQSEYSRESSSLRGIQTRFEIPPLIFTYGHCSLIVFTALMKSTP
mmetsp:Transcript_11568/g.16875  ORF Transcript_11568/g.16875 Transcript_11568/m.16875 type:complete len:174 (-) Transcript_11568:68-589(-)